MPRKYSKEQVAGWAEAFPELFIEHNGNITKVMLALGVAGPGAKGSRARALYASLMQNEEMQVARALADEMLADEFRETAIRMGRGLETKVKNNYAGMKYLETREPQYWSPKQQVEVSGGGFSAEDLKEEADKRAGRSDEVEAAVFSVIGGGGSRNE